MHSKVKDKMTKSILVTGAAGFIGSHIVDKFVANGWDVVGVDDLTSGDLENVNRGIKELMVNNFAAEHVLKRIWRKEFDVVCHHAALPRVLFSVEHPAATNEVNVDNTVKLLEACRDNVSRFIFASSSSVYGNTDTLPTSPLQIKQPCSPYALQKSIVEDYCSLFSDLYGLDTICLRYFNVFGPRAKGDSPYSTAVAAWLAAIKANKELRSDGDGEQSRDLCYVDNVVQANWLAANSKRTFTGDCYNVACGDRTTNNQILDYLLKKFPDVSIKHAPERLGDVKHTQADISATADDLEYKNAVSFWDGLEQTIKSMDLAI
jgi:nucleoside-diphosphate-sugar epimerase